MNVTTARGRMLETLRVAVPWAALWLAFWTLVGLTIRVADPDSLDPGESWLIVVVFGPMGLFSGVIFGVLLSRRARSEAPRRLEIGHVAGAGIVATAVVQVAYLGHGDQGLAANVLLALLFSIVGGLVSLGWFGIAGRSPRWGIRQQATGE